MPEVFLQSKFFEIFKNNTKALGVSLGAKVFEIAFVIWFFYVLFQFTHFISIKFYVLDYLANLFTVCVILIYSKAFYSYFTLTGSKCTSPDILYYFFCFLVIFSFKQVIYFKDKISVICKEHDWFDHCSLTAYSLLASNCLILILSPHSLLL